MIRTFVKDLKYCRQRINRGWCNADLYSIYDWFLATVPSMQEQYRQTRHGSPSILVENYQNRDGVLVNDTCHKEWDAILERMVFLFHETDPERLSFCTTIFIHPQFLPSNESENESGNESGKSTQRQTREHREQAILTAMQANSEITIVDLVKNLSIPESTVNRILHKMKSEGVIRREGSSKNGRWVIL